MNTILRLSYGTYSYQREIGGITAAGIIEMVESQAADDPFFRAAGTVELFDVETKTRIAWWDCAPSLTRRGK